MQRVLVSVSMAVAATAEATWTPMTPAASPAARESHAMVHDPASQRTFVLFDKVPERYDVMYQFATGGVHTSISSLIAAL